MGTNYPGAVDSLTNPAAGDALNSPSHAAQHADANDAIEAVQAELGTTPSGSESTVAARLDKIEAGTNLGTNSVGATQLADNAVDTAAIADSAVTSAKIADGTIVSSDVAAGTFASFATVGNLLTANQASPATTGAYTLESGTSESTAGVYTAATSDVVACYTTLSVTAGETYTVSVNLAPVGRSATALLSFRDAGGGSVGGFPQSASVPAGGSARVTLTAVAPATATTVRVYPMWSGTGAGGDTVTVTRVGFWKGAGGQWAMPGTPITNTGIRPNPSNTAEVQIWNDATATWITV